jgi:DegV family protein with EDD domain
MLKIVTDSAADMTEVEIDALDIVQAPLYIRFPEGEVASSDIGPDAFYDRLEALFPTIPTTAQPSSGQFAELYSRVSGGQDILSIHVSSGLSGTLNAASVGSAMATETGETGEITVFDSLTLSGGQRYQVLAAALAARRGWDKAAILDRLAEIRTQTEIIYTLETLDYLARGGRIGRVAALAGGLLKLKPIIHVEHADGKYTSVGRARTVSAALEVIARHLAHGYGRTPVWVTVLHGRWPDPAAALSRLLEQHLEVARLDVLRVSPVLGVHTGPGVVGAAVAPIGLFAGLE